jgi:(2Fe-2S) ferredoxin
MHKPKYHFFVCNSFRVSGEPQGACNKKGAVGLLQYLQEGINDHGIDATVSLTGCMNVCEKGPVMVIYPNAWWYGEVTEDKIDEILDALEQDQPVENLLLA